MFKKILCVFLSVAIAFCMVVPVAFADDDIAEHEHKWTSVPIGVSGEFKGFKYEVSAKQCSVCKLYDHVIKFGEIEYNYLSMTADPGADGMLQSILLKLYGYIFGAYASTSQVPADETKDLPGYDDNNSALVSNDGMQRVRATFKFFLNYDSDKQPIESFTVGSSQFYAVGTPGQVILTSENNSQGLSFSGGYFPVTQLPGYYTLPAGTEVYNFNYYQGTTNYPSNPNVSTELLGYGLSGNYKTFHVTATDTSVYYFYVNDCRNKSNFTVSSTYTHNYQHSELLL